jgi:hypothetical protein
LDQAHHLLSKRPTAHQQNDGNDERPVEHHNVSLMKANLVTIVLYVGAALLRDDMLRSLYALK